MMFVKLFVLLIVNISAVAMVNCFVWAYFGETLSTYICAITDGHISLGLVLWIYI
jgi:hypothetical protein